MYTVIAALTDDNLNVVGYRVIDNRSGIFMDIDSHSMYTFIERVEVGNLAKREGELTLTDGSINSIPHVNARTLQPVKNNNTLVVTSSTGKEGKKIFKVAHYSGVINILDEQTMVNLQGYTFYNAKIVTRNGKTFISAIKLGFTEEEILQSIQEAQPKRAQPDMPPELRGLQDRMWNEFNKAGDILFQELFRELLNIVGRKLTASDIRSKVRAGKTQTLSLAFLIDNKHVIVDVEQTYEKPTEDYFNIHVKDGKGNAVTLLSDIWGYKPELEGYLLNLNRVTKQGKDLEQYLIFQAHLVAHFLKATNFLTEGHSALQKISEFEHLKNIELHHKINLTMYQFCMHYAQKNTQSIRDSYADFIYGSKLK